MDNHGKKNIEKGNENIKNLYFSFFNISNDSSLEEHNIFYKSNIEKWTNNAIELKYQYPFEIAVYVADLFNSDFTLSFILKSATTNFREAEDWTLEKKVSFIVSYFENGYNYFGLLIHASNYTSSYIAGLEENWVVSIFECLRT